ncbi:hypothetical protein MY5147_009621 [Beauveria neobassiana]
MSPAASQKRTHIGPRKAVVVLGHDRCISGAEGFKESAPWSVPSCAESPLQPSGAM